MTGPLPTPAVSVVLPVHDTPAAFLREAIDSVRAQREVAWEAVIVMDATTTTCAALADAAAEDDPGRIRVVGQVGGTPLGASAARNLGIANSRGAVLGFLDADDMYEPDALATRLHVLEEHPEVAMVYGTTVYWHQWNVASRTKDHVPALGVPPGSVHPPPALVTRILDGSAAIPPPCSILVRRWAIDAVGGFDESFPGLYDDQVFYARLALRFSLLADGHVLDRYRQHPESMTARASQAREREARARFLTWLETEALKTGVDDVALPRVIAHERWKLRHPRLARVIRIARRAASRLAAAAPSQARTVQP